VALGGRLAEEMIYGEGASTTGASNDLERVADTARRMVMEFGMSDQIGPVNLEGDGDDVWGYEIMELAESEVERIVNQAYVVGKKVLTENRVLLEKTAEKLLDQDQVSAEEFQLLIAEHGAYMADYSVYGSAEPEKLPYKDVKISSIWSKDMKEAIATASAKDAVVV
jgi:cell division protease FtsH